MKNILISATVALLISLGTYHYVEPQNSAQAADQQESAFERVLRTNTLRCGYWNWSPLFSVDGNTKELGGIFYEYTNAIGEVLDINIEWVEELGFADFYLAIQSGKIDAMCAGVWPLAPRAKVMEFTDPIFYIPMHFYTRKGDTRFDNNIDAINSPDVKISTMDGLVAHGILKQSYSNADIKSITELNTVSDLYEMLTTGKVDVTLNDVFTTNEYTKNNPNTLHKVAHTHPFSQFGNTIAVNKDEMKLKRLLDFATRQLQASGVVEKIIQKYESEKGFIYRPTYRYREGS